MDQGLFRVIVVLIFVLDVHEMAGIEPALLQGLRLDIELPDFIVPERPVSRREILHPDGRRVLAFQQLIDAVVEKREADILLESRRDQDHFQRFERINGAVGRLAVHKHELLPDAGFDFGDFDVGHDRFPQSPNTTSRSATIPASTS